MTTGVTPSLLGQIRTLFVGGTSVGLGEGELVERFLARSDQSAFETIVARHGPMVLGVCRRALHDDRDAEDAFQATFLVLLQKAGTIRDRDALGPWLYGVARRVARRARVESDRRGSRERPGPEVEAAVAPPSDPDHRELLAVIDEEIGRLPELYRSPVVLCYLEGLTHEEAAARLRWPVGTVRSRMARARDRLRGRLARRGLALSAALLATALAPETLAAPLPPALLALTLKAALGLAADGTRSAAVSAAVSSLSEGVIQTMSMPSLKSVAASLLVTGSLAGGAVVTAQQFGGSRGGTPAPEAKPVSPIREVRILDRLSQADREIEAAESRLKEAQTKRQGLLNELAAERGSLEPSRTSPKATPNTSSPDAPAVKASVSGNSTMMGSMMSGTTPNPPAMLGMMSGPPPGQPGMSGVGMMGGAAPEQAYRKSNRVVASGDLVVLSTPEGRGVAVFTEGKPKSLYRAPAGVKSFPLVVGDIVSLALYGERITEVAAYSKEQGRWVVHPLPEPVAGPVLPIVAGTTVGLRAGRFLGAFDGRKGTWDVARLNDAYQTVPPLPPGSMGDGSRPFGGEPVYALQPNGGQSSTALRTGGAAPDGVYGPIVGPTLVAFRAGRQAWGYSVATGHWDVADLGEESGPPPTVAGHFLTVVSNRGMYLFDEKSGKWEGVDLGKDDEK